MRETARRTAPAAEDPRRAARIADRSPDAGVHFAEERAVGRPEVQRTAQLQEVANRSPQVRQLRAMQAMVDRSHQDRSGKDGVVQAVITPGGRFASQEGKYADAYGMFVQALAEVTPDFQAIRDDPLTQLVLTTAPIPTSGETSVEVEGPDKEWRPSSDPTMREFLRPDARVRIVLALTEPGAVSDWSYPQILQTTSHEWGVHGNFKWQFVKWMRSAGSAEEVQDEWANRDRKEYEGPDPLHGDVHHALLAEGKAAAFESITGAMLGRLQEPERGELAKLTQEDIEYHQPFNRTQKASADTGGASSSTAVDPLADFAPEIGADRLDEWLDQ